MSEQETTETAAQASATSIERQVTKGTKLVVQGSKQALHNPLFAINWFDTRVSWIYHLYNHLSASRLYKIGGKVFFKGKVTRMIAGDASLARRYLLIVNYPSAEHFLDLAADRLFQLFSVLRIIAVKNFSFVMHQRIEGRQLMSDQRQPWAASNAYALLHFVTNEPIADVVSTLREIASDDSIHVHFASQQAATLAVQTGSDPIQNMPFVTQNVVILEASHASELAELVDGKKFRQLTSSFQNFYAGTVTRLL